MFVLQVSKIWTLSDDPNYIKSSAFWQKGVNYIFDKASSSFRKKFLKLIQLLNVKLLIRDDFKTQPPVDQRFCPVPAGFYCFKQWQLPRTRWNKFLTCYIGLQYSHSTIRCTTSDWLRKGQNLHYIMGKCWQTNAMQYEITHEHVSNDLKMWIKWLHTEIHDIITVYIHNRSIYFKTITCKVLGLVISNLFACKTNSVFSDFVDSCATGKRNRTRIAAIKWHP